MKAITIMSNFLFVMIPNMIAWTEKIKVKISPAKIRVLEELFCMIENLTWGPQLGLGSAFTGFFPPAFFIAAMYLRR